MNPVNPFYKRWEQLQYYFYLLIGHHQGLQAIKFRRATQQLDFRVVQDNESEVQIARKNERIYLRRLNSSDISVFMQVYRENDYESVIRCARLNEVHPQLIIDCGANIGLTALKFSQEFPSAKLICIEPDKHNFQQLERNTGHLEQIELLQNAVWYEKTRLNLSRAFRDGLDWSVAVDKNSSPSVGMEGAVETVTLVELLPEKGGIDILKIDIEGAEGDLLAPQHRAHEFLNRTRLIAVEIHEELVDKSQIIATLRSAGFWLFESGEHLIGLNQKLAQLAN